VRIDRINLARIFVLAQHRQQPTGNLLLVSRGADQGDAFRREERVERMRHGVSFCYCWAVTWSFRGDAKHRTMVRNCAPENLEIPGLVLAHHPGMTEQKNWMSYRKAEIDAAHKEPVT